MDVNPWVYVDDNEPEFDVSKLSYRCVDHFIEENNHLGKYSNGLVHLQGLVNFRDNRKEDGGFHAVPGFSKYFYEWTQSTKDDLRKDYGKREAFIVIPVDEECAEHAQRITAPAGCVIIWDQRTMHGSAPNESNQIRYCQFIKYFRAIDIHSQRGQKRANAVSKLTENFEEITPLGRKLFGLESW